MIRRSKYYKGANGPTAKLQGDCAIDGCPRPQFRRELCCAHFKRLQRNKPVDGLIGGGLELAEVLDPEERVVTLGSAMLEANSEDDAAYNQKKRAWLKACEELMRSKGWRPPLKKGRR